IGSSNQASSVYITAVPNDELLEIVWEHNTPWVESEYEVFRFDGSDWIMLGTSTGESYVDTGLVNGEEYCYYVKSIGAYSDTTITAPLINFSQETCGIPIDLTPPCPPVVLIDNDCEFPLNTLAWNNTDDACPNTDDTDRYNIYFSPTLDG